MEWNKHRCHEKKLEEVFEKLVGDVISGSQESMSQKKPFLATRLALQAQAQAYCLWIKF